MIKKITTTNTKNIISNKNIKIVLVNPSHPGNIGGAARAMKTMNLSELVLVNPKEYPDPRAVWRAAGAQDVLSKTSVVKSLDEAIADCHFVVGTSARERRIPWPVVDARECAHRIYDEPSSSGVAILFGREDSGLNNDELQRCNLHVHVPTNSDYSSLNLAMAVQIISYELRMRFIEVQSKNLELNKMTNNEWDEPYANANEINLFHEHLEQTLLDLKFYNPEEPKQLLTRLRRLFARVRMDKMEINILRGILSAVQKKL